jgi:hypothetical protein
MHSPGSIERRWSPSDLARREARDRRRRGHCLGSTETHRLKLGTGPFRYGRDTMGGAATTWLTVRSRRVFERSIAAAALHESAERQHAEAKPAERDSQFGKCVDCRTGEVAGEHVTHGDQPVRDG